MTVTAEPSQPQNSWFNFLTWGGGLTSPAKWTEVNNNNDKAGRAIYLSSDIDQTQLND